MEILDFTTKDQRNIAISNFKTLVDHPGWKLFEAIVMANIEKVKDQILHGVENETKEMIDRKRDRLRVYEECISTPKTMIAKLADAETIFTSYDPFDTVGDIAKRRKH